MPQIVEPTSTDNGPDAQREIIRESLNELAAAIGMAMRDEGLQFPVYITVRNSGGTRGNDRDAARSIR